MHIDDNKLRKSLKNKLLLIILGCLLIIAITVDNIFFTKYKTDKESTKHVENVICKFDKDAETTFQKFKKSYVGKNKDYNTFFEKNNLNYFTSLLYIDSTLVYWSNNNSNYAWYINPLIDTGYIFETNNSIVYNKVFTFDKHNFYVAQLPIIHTYNVENKYLHNGLTDIFNVSSNYKVDFKNFNGKNQIITNTNNIPLFSIYKIDRKNRDSSLFSNILFIISMIYIVMLIVTILDYNNKLAEKPAKLWIIALTVVTLRLLIYIASNCLLSNTILFTGEYFEEGILLDSCGDLVITASCIMILAISIFTNCYIFCKKYNSSHFIKILFSTIIVLLIIITFFSIYKWMIDSSLNVHFFNFSQMNVGTVMITIALIFIMTAGVMFGLSLYLFITPKKTDDLVFKHPLIVILIVSMFFTLIYNSANLQREKLITKEQAQNNIFTRKNIFEKNLESKIKELEKDSVTNKININKLLENGESQQFNSIIAEKFKDSFWPNYYVNYVIADSNSTMKINNDTLLYNSNEYFSSIIKNDGIKIKDNIWYINDIQAIPYYLCKIQTNKYSIWLDIIPKYNIEGSGYPELLSTNEKINKQINFSELSLAIYENGVLIRNFGTFTYPLLENTNLFAKNNIYVTKHYKHFLYNNNSDSNIDIIITKPYSIFNNYLSPLSILFIIFMLILLAIRFIFLQNPSNLNFSSLKTRMQTSVISFFLLTIIMTGAFSVYLIIKLNNSKNNNALQDKTYSLYKNIDMIINNLDTCSKEDMNNIVKDMSYTNFVDVNVYDEDGYLYCTSNDEMFNNNLTSNLINPQAYSKLINDNRYIGEESIGKYKFLSSYIILVDKHSKMYIVNIPYFIKQTELKKEISDYITSFLNIYIIIILLSIIIAYYLTRYITLPLNMLEESMSKLSLKNNENIKIEYIKNDEIGALVNVYNNKVDELQRSIDLLAKSERESAWREMARQIAHEIKNPLTPMKLSTQYICKLWDDNSPTFDAQLKKYKDSMVTEIDNLSNIATAFSNFAKMPVEVKKDIDINELINQIIDLYQQADISINFNTNHDRIIVNADPNLMSRIFHNIIRNSIQAYQSESHKIDEKLIISIDTYFEQNNEGTALDANSNSTESNAITSSQNCSTVIIRIKDNGPGIAEDVKDKIFVPNFTTKSSGTGIGLTIVKKIVANMKGSIKLIGYINGAEFEIRFPAKI